MLLKLRKYLQQMRRSAGRLTAMQIIVVVFLAIVLVGSLLLSLPAASKSGIIPSSTSLS